MTKTITARYDSRCKNCKQAVFAGTEVVWTKGQGVVHVECPTPETEAEKQAREAREAEYQAQAAEAQRIRDLDTVLYRVTPNQIAAMDKDEAQEVIDFHRNTPPTMDYMVEYTRSLREMELAKQRIAYLEAYPEVGQSMTITERPGYKIEQERPFECRPSASRGWGAGCVCGECDGKLIEHRGVVEKVYNYADNSREAMVRCEDGELRIKRLEMPHGDIC